MQASPPTSDGLSGELLPPTNSFPYGLALSGALLSGALGDTSGLSVGDSVELGVGDSVGLGDGDGAVGKAFAITVRIFATVAAVRYAG